MRLTHYQHRLGPLKQQCSSSGLYRMPHISIQPSAEKNGLAAEIPFDIASRHVWANTLPLLENSFVAARRVLPGRARRIVYARLGGFFDHGDGVTSRRER